MGEGVRSLVYGLQFTVKKIKRFTVFSLRSKKINKMTIEQKINFLEIEFIEFLKTLESNAKGKWGVMNAQQMVEHMSYSLRDANGKSLKRIVTPLEHLPKYKEFAMSDKPFKENTKNIELPETAIPVKHSSMQNAIDEMKAEWIDFKKAFEGNPTKTITNPFFGDLNFEEWVLLHYKHILHHARQFGLI